MKEHQETIDKLDRYLRDKLQLELKDCYLICQKMKENYWLELTSEDDEVQDEDDIEDEMEAEEELPEYEDDDDEPAPMPVKPKKQPPKPAIVKPKIMLKKEKMKKVDEGDF